MSARTDSPYRSGVVVSIAKPINDVLGFRNDDRYANWLGQDWQELTPSRREAATYARLRDELATIAAAASKEGGRSTLRNSRRSSRV